MSILKQCELYREIGCAQLGVNETRHNGVKHNYQQEKKDVRGCIIHSLVCLLLKLLQLPLNPYIHLTSHFLFLFLIRIQLIFSHQQNNHAITAV